jgi:hypothetical protein
VLRKSTVVGTRWHRGSHAGRFWAAAQTGQIGQQKALAAAGKIFSVAVLISVYNSPSSCNFSPCPSRVRMRQVFAWVGSCQTPRFATPSQQTGLVRLSAWFTSPRNAAMCDISMKWPIALTPNAPRSSPGRRPLKLISPGIHIELAQRGILRVRFVFWLMFTGVL